MPYDARRRPSSLIPVMVVCTLLSPALGNRAVVAAGTEDGGVVITRDGMLQIRSGPGAEHSVAGSAAKGSVLTVLETVGEWRRVRLSDGVEGYALGTYVHVPPASVSAGWQAEPAAVEAHVGPRRVASIPTKTGLEIHLKGDHAYLTGPSSVGTDIYDVSDPSAPALVGHSELGGRMSLDGEHAYMVDDDGFHVLDLREPASPVLVASLAGQSFTCVAARGAYAHVVDLSGTVLTLDVADPFHPRLEGPSRFAPGAFGRVYQMASDGNHVVIAGRRKVGVMPAAPGADPLRSVSYQAFRGPWNDVTIQDGIAYLTNVDGLGIVNLSGPEFSRWECDADPVRRPHGIAVAGPHAFVADTVGLRILDVSGPRKPTLVDVFQIAGGAEGVAVGRGHAYVTRQGAVDVLDVSRLSSPQESAEAAGDARLMEGETIFESEQIAVVTIAGSDVQAEATDEIIYRPALFEPLVLQEEPAGVLTPYGEIGRIDPATVRPMSILLLSGRTSGVGERAARNFRVLGCRVVQTGDATRVQYRVQFQGGEEPSDRERIWVDRAETTLWSHHVLVALGRELLAPSAERLYRIRVQGETYVPMKTAGFARAERIFEEVLGRYPFAPYFGDADEAEYYEGWAGNGSPAGIVALDALADVAVYRGQYRQAIRWLERIVEGFPHASAGITIPGEWSIGGGAAALAKLKIADIHAAYLRDIATACGELQDLIRNHSAVEVGGFEWNSTLGLMALDRLSKLGEEGAISHDEMLGHLEAAERNAEAGVTKVQAALLRADLLCTTKRLDEAIGVLMEAVRESPDSSMTFYKDDVYFSDDAFGRAVDIAVEELNDAPRAIALCRGVLQEQRSAQLLRGALRRMAEVLDRTVAPREEVIAAYEAVARAGNRLKTRRLGAIRSFHEYPATVCARGATLFFRADKASAAMLTLEPSARVTVLYPGSVPASFFTWYKVETAAGTVGWLTDTDLVPATTGAGQRPTATADGGRRSPRDAGETEPLRELSVPAVSVTAEAKAVVAEIERTIEEMKTSARWPILHGLSPIVWAVRQHDPTLLRKVIAEGVDLDQPGARERGFTALLEAVLSHDREAVAILLDSGADPEKPTTEDCYHESSPLCVAVDADEPEMVRLLARAGADVDRGMPLVYAARENLPAMVSTLLALGARPDTKDARGFTALMYAAARGDRAAVSSLCNAGADRELMNAYAERAIDAARRWHGDDQELLKMLEPDSRSR